MPFLTTARAGARPLGRILCAAVCLAASLHAGEEVFKLPSLADLPKFMDEVEHAETKKGKVHENGLVATVNFEQFKLPKKASNFELEELYLPDDLTHFQKELKIHVALQPGKAPLAVFLNGFYGKEDDKLSEAAERYLFEAGCHVLTIRSIFRNDMNEITGHGAAGNVRKDAEAIATMIDTFLISHKDGRPTFRELTTSVRVLGISYGGYLALNLAKLPQAKSWPIDRTLVLGSPVKLQTAAANLDRFQREDRPRHVQSLLKLIDGFTPSKDQPDEEEESLMRAGIAYTFYGELSNIVSHNEESYKPGLCELFKFQEKARENERKAAIKVLETRFEADTKALDAAGGPDVKKQKKALEARFKCEKADVERCLSNSSGWTFTEYATQLCAPAWKTDPAELWKFGDLNELLEGAPAYVQAVVPLDDPLNKKEETAALLAKFPEPKVLAIPHGGHLGFMGTQWVRALIKLQFGPDTATSIAVPTPH